MATVPGETPVMEAADDPPAAGRPIVPDSSIVTARVPRSGFGNRVFGVAECMVFANLTGSVVECVWPINSECPGHFHDVFNVPDNVRFVAAGKAECDLATSWNPAKFWQRYKTELNMPLLEFLRRVRSEIRQLQFTADVTAQGEALLNRSDTTAGAYLAVHWRGTDRFRGRKRMVRHFKDGLVLALRRWPLLERLETAVLPIRLLEQRQLERTKRAIARAGHEYRDVLIASDDAGVAAVLASHVQSLGGRGLMFEHDWNPARRRRQTSLRGAGIDLWLLSNARGIVGTDFNSSFLAVACIRAGRQPLNGDVRFSSEIHGEALT